MYNLENFISSWEMTDFMQWDSNFIHLYLNITAQNDSLCTWEFMISFNVHIIIHFHMYMTI